MKEYISKLEPVNGSYTEAIFTSVYENTYTFWDTNSWSLERFCQITVEGYLH